MQRNCCILPAYMPTCNLIPESIVHHLSSDKTEIQRPHYELTGGTYNQHLIVQVQLKKQLIVQLKIENQVQETPHVCAHFL